MALANLAMWAYKPALHIDRGGLYSPALASLYTVVFDTVVFDTVLLDTLVLDMEQQPLPKAQTLGSEISPLATSTMSPLDGSISLHDAQTLQNIQQESRLEQAKDEESDFEEGSSAESRNRACSYSSGPSVVTFNFWGILGRGAINVILPFINGIALGFGEILAHEVGFRYGFLGARVYPPIRMERKRPRSKFI